MRPTTAGQTRKRAGCRRGSAGAGRGSSEGAAVDPGSDGSGIALQVRPGGRQVEARAAADEDVEVLVGHRQRMMDVAGEADVAEEARQGRGVVVEDDHDLASVAARAPEEIAEVAAERR